MGEVVSITGGEVAAPGEKVESIISLLELYLADAKAGNVTAIAVISLDHEMTATSGHSIVKGRLTMAGALGLFQHRIYQDIAEGKE